MLGRAETLLATMLPTVHSGLGVTALLIMQLFVAQQTQLFVLKTYLETALDGEEFLVCLEINASKETQLDA
jgi:hypothetical protein